MRITGNSGINTSIAPGVGVNISGHAIDDALAPDADEQALLSGARASNDAYYQDLQSERSGIADLFAGTADRVAQETGDAFRRMADNQANQAYSDGLEQQTYSAYRNGNTQGSANAKQQVQLYKTSQAQRIANSIEARRRAEAARQSVLSQEGSLQDAMAGAMGMGAATDNQFLDAYQGSRPQEISPLAAYLEDTLTGLSMGSAAGAGGVDDAYGVVFG